MSKTTDYVTEMFHKLREDISWIKHRLFMEKPNPESSTNDPAHHYTIDAVHANHQSAQENDQPIRAVLNLPPTIHVDATTEERQKHWYKDRTVLLQGGTIFVGSVVAVIYACQLRQMIKSNTLTKQTLEISQRASVVLGRKDGILAEFVYPTNLADKAGILIYFQNSGHSPAKINWGLDSITEIPTSFPIKPATAPTTTDKPFLRMKRTRSKKDRNAVSETGQTIGGDSLFFDYIDIPITGRRLAEIREKGGIIMGTVSLDFCDSLGTYNCTTFSVAYQGKPLDRFKMLDAIECLPEWGRAKPDPDVEELSPCKMEDH